MIALLLAVMVSGRLAAPAPPCPTGCVPGQTCYTLVLRWVENIATYGPPVYQTRETFTGEDYPTREDALCAARKIRRDGAELPVDAHGGAIGNVMPDTITPMPVI